MQVPDSLCTDRRSFRSLPGRGERGLLACGFMTKAGGWDCQQAARSSYSAVLVLRGRGWYADADGHRWDLQPGSLFQRFCGVKHSLWIEPDVPWAECWIHLGEISERLLADLGVIDRERPVFVPGIDLALVRELDRAVDALEAAPERALPRQLVRLHGMLLSLLGSDAAPVAGGFDADRACRLLGDDPCVDLRLVAEELAMPYSSFRKAFRLAVGIGPGEYRLRRRLDRARAALLESARPIAAIAAELGYHNPFAFSTLFRKHVGVSPSAWRTGAVARARGTKRT